MKKIAIVAPGNLPVPAINGGAVESLIDIFVGIASKRNNYKIDVYSVSDSLCGVQNIRRGNISYIQVPYKVIRDTIANKLICKAYPQYKFRYFIKYVCTQLSKIRYDAVIVENRPTFIYDISRHTNAKIFLHLHNENFVAIKKFCRNVPSHCEKIIVVSEYIKKVVEKNMKAANNVEVLHNGIDVSRFKKATNMQARNTIRNKYGIPKENLVVCYTGRFSPEKGVLEVVKAFSKLNELSGVTLLIIGSSWFGSNQKNSYITEVENEAKKCTNKIIFTGYVNNEEVASIESVSDIAVLPSLWNDPLPLTIIEAMGSGLPIITTEVGGIPEMCTSETGILLNRHDHLAENIEKALRDLIQNEEKRIELGSAARKRAEKYFSVDEYYNNFVRILDSEE